MNILCYGESARKQKLFCEFFQGANWCAEWATGPDAALTLLANKRFDSVVFGRSIPASECERLAELMRSVRPNLEFFSLAAIDGGLPGDKPPLLNERQSLISVYTKLNSRRATVGTQSDS